MKRLNPNPPGHKDAPPGTSHPHAILPPVKTELNEAEKLSIKRLKAKGLTNPQIADQVGVSIEMVKSINSKINNF